MPTLSGVSTKQSKHSICKQVAVFLTVSTCYAAVPLSETTYGISRIVTLKSVPNIECIKSIINTTDGIQSVDDLYPSSLDGKLWSFRYEGNGVWANLTIRLQSDRRFELVHTRLSVDHRLAKAEVTKTLTMMKLVESRLMSGCNIAELSQIQMKCHRVDCERDH